MFPGDVRWEPVEKFHGTIRFLGPTPPVRADRLREKLRSVASASRPFDITVERFGAFPSFADPRVFWIGCANPDGNLARLAASIARETAVLGYPPEDHPLMPHITLGRVVKSASGGGGPKWWSQTHLTSKVKRLTFTPHHTVVGRIFRISLMESVLRPSGSTYRSVEEFSLTTGDSWAENEGSSV